jgi:hypothetical protein
MMQELRELLPERRIVPKTIAFYSTRQSLCCIYTAKPYGVNYLARYSLCGKPHWVYL